MIPAVTERERTLESAAEAWAGAATRGARKVVDETLRDFGRRMGHGESRQRAYERDEEGAPRVSIAKLCSWPIASLLTFCRALLGTAAVVVEVKPSAIVLDDAAHSTTKEAADVVMAALTKARTPETLATIEREARELAALAVGIEIAARAERDLLTTSNLRGVCR